MSHIYLPMKMGQSVPKRRYINSKRRGITQKKAYNTEEEYFLNIRRKTKRRRKTHYGFVTDRETRRANTALWLGETVSERRRGGQRESFVGRVPFS